MARGQRRPGRTLAVFFAALAVAYVGVALLGTWKPTLGLDLQGGTRITLIAKGSPTAADLAEANRIVDQRVNGSGISEASVTTQGSKFIVVEIPGESRSDLVRTVERQAQLRFRLVACTSQDQKCGPSSPQSKPGRSGKQGGGSGSANQSPSSQPKSGPTDYGDPLTWMDKPDQASVRAFQRYECPPAGTSSNVNDDPDRPLVTCDDKGVKYLLSVAVVEGTELTSASASIPQNQVGWVVNLSLNSQGTDEFAKVSRALYGTDKQFAIVLDGHVISAPTMNGIIADGRAEISGNFTQQTAASLATSLRYGALPIAFEPDPPLETIGPSLAGDQLHAGLLAGAIGLGLVMVYCLLYYRGLGLVVIASLFVAAATTYALVLLLSNAAGFAVSLPGIAGLIVGVGITADSFIVYFERIRDEMRDGRPMRLALETGWVRARNTCLAADTVSLLAAVVLYVFAAGVVKGFAFALGLATVVDLMVFFWFTHPMLGWLGRFSFFRSGHRLSGLSASTLGIDSPTALRHSGSGT